MTAWRDKRWAEKRDGRSDAGMRRLLFWLGVLLLIAELGAVAMGAVYASRQALALRQDLQVLAQLKPSLSLATLSERKLGTLQAALQDASERARRLEQLWRGVQPFLAPALRMPAAVAEQRQINGALTAVQEGAALTQQLTSAAQTLLGAIGTHPDALTLAQLLEHHQRALADLEVETVDLERALSLVGGGKLTARYQPDLNTLKTALPLLQRGLQLSVIAPPLVTTPQPLHFLIVAQDPQDLRPTGGFIGSLGLLTETQGKIDYLDYRPYGAWENVRDPYRAWPVQTAPVQRYLHFCCMDIQDANWYPDFPTTALVLEQFFQVDQPSTLDGVIAFEPAAVEALLRVTGPVKLPQLAVPVTAENFLELANYFEGRGHPNLQLPPVIVFHTAKGFLIDVAHVLLQRLRHSGAGALLKVARVLPALLAQKQLLLYINDPALEAWLEALDWAGAVNTPPGDYVFLDEMSMSDNKVDLYIERTLSERVQLQSDGSADVHLQIAWRNTYPHAVEPGAGSAAGIPPTTAFRDFFRLYLPLGTTVQRTAGITEPWPAETADGHLVVRGFIAVPQGGGWQVSVTYHIPAAVIATAEGAAYVLHVQIQPGISPPVYHLELLAPDGQQLLTSAVQLSQDEVWRVPLAGIAAVTPPAPPATDRYCTALRLVAGLRGPYSYHRVHVPPQCAPGFKGS